MKLINKKVTIKKNTDSWAAGEWGIVVKVENDQYHVAMYGDNSSTLVFDRSEFTVNKENAQ